MKAIFNVSRILVGGLFIFSGLIKINDPVGTAIKLEEYFHVFAEDFGDLFLAFVPYVLPLSIFLCVLEVILGVALLIKYRLRITVALLMLTIVFFTFLTFYSAYFNKVTDCGCFGDAIKLTPWESFSKDVILLILIFIMALYLYAGGRKGITFNKSKAADFVMLGVTVVCVGIAIYAVEHLPYLDFRAYKVGTSIPTDMQASEPLQYEYIMVKDGKEEAFRDYPTDPAYEFKEMKLLNPEAQAKITDYNLWNDEGDFTEQSFVGSKLAFIMYNTDKTDAESLEEIKSLLARLPANIEPVILTSTSGQKLDSFLKEKGLNVPYYFADATVLKTIIRSNPGIVLLDEGTVKGKWHYNDLPSVAEINRLAAR
ncbi:BT_3928 family protein [Roseivirga sp. BDSF3-8]|uniref:BT_3928 family protein n=1 Tax=Roseivirga sp. BDSF3-8 TaxID=3241598 RepID=UPI003531E92B